MNRNKCESTAARQKKGCRRRRFEWVVSKWFCHKFWLHFPWNCCYTTCSNGGIAPFRNVYIETGNGNLMNRLELFPLGWSASRSMCVFIHTFMLDIFVFLFFFVCAGIIFVHFVSVVVTIFSLATIFVRAHTRSRWKSSLIAILRNWYIGMTANAHQANYLLGTHWDNERQKEREREPPGPSMRNSISRITHWCTCTFVLYGPHSHSSHLCWPDTRCFHGST